MVFSLFRKYNSRRKREKCHYFQAHFQPISESENHWDKAGTLGRVRAWSYDNGFDPKNISDPVD